MTLLLVGCGVAICHLAIAPLVSTEAQCPQIQAALDLNSAAGCKDRGQAVPQSDGSLQKKMDAFADAAQEIAQEWLRLPASSYFGCVIVFQDCKLS